MTVEVDAKKVAAHAPKAEFKKKWNLVPANHPLLSTKLENFDLKNPPVDPVELATDMLAHMRYFGGIGLSANQLGLPFNMFVLGDHPGMEKGLKMTCFNPMIISASADQVMMKEGCLTFPFVFLNISRPRKVTVKYEDENGDLKEGHLDGMISRVFQHEYDHMLGKTFVDGVSKMKLDMAYKKAEKQMKKYKKMREQTIIKK